MEGSGNSAKAQDAMENVYSSVGLWILVQRASVSVSCIPEETIVPRHNQNRNRKGDSLVRKEKQSKSGSGPVN